MKKYFLSLPILALLFLANSCSTVPLTGRSQLNLIPENTMMEMSFQQYGEFIKSNKLSTNAAQIKMVKTVTEKLKIAVQKYMKDNNLEQEIKSFTWENSLIENDQINAWCMPGGKMVTYTGILKVTGDEAGLAVVIGHEIAHAVAKHGNERMSQGLLTQLGGIAISKALEQKPQETQKLWMTAFGLGAQVGLMLPYSRMHENEADKLGIIFMAMAGYDPNKAVEFWSKMAKMNTNSKPPEFLSTHPSDETRIENLKKIIPEAMNYYKKK